MSNPKALAGMKPATGKLPTMRTPGLPKKVRVKTGRKAVARMKRGS